MNPLTIPDRVKSRFPEYEKENLNIKDFKWLLIERLLENGTREEVRWLFSCYSQEDLIAFLREKGERRLSRRNLVFWSSFFGLPLPTHKKNPLWES